MIPVRLTLRNFMSYGEENTTLDFTGMHVACLSGDNGNGKSALIDAMTYALWGKTRASGSQASSEDDLIRLGAEEMEVQLTFRLGEDLYRVLRKRNRRLRAADWQAQVQDPGGTWLPVGGGGMHDTGRHLARLLRMEYETFLSSAYIQQGQADAFTRQKPMDRKRILADILDLSRYDRLEEMARERRSECELALKDLEGEIRHYEARADEEAHYREKLTEQEEAVSRWTAERAQREPALKQLLECQSALDAKAQRLREREERLHEAEGEVVEIEGEIARLQARIAQDAVLLARRDILRAELERLIAHRLLMEQLEADVRVLNDARQSYAVVQASLEASRERLLRELDRAEAEWRSIEERDRRLAELDARLADLAPKLAHFEKARTERERVRASLLATQERFTRLSSESKQIKAAIAEVEEVLQILAEPKPACPVCQSDLSGGRQAAVVMKQRQKVDALKERLGEINREGAACKQERDALQAQADTLEEQLHSEAALRAQRVEMLKERERVAAAETDRAAVRARLLELQQRVKAEDYGPEERTQLCALEQQIARLETAGQRYAEAERVVRELTSAQVERTNLQLDQAERSYAEASTEIGKLKARRDRRMAQMAQERTRQAAMRDELAEYDSVRLEVATAERALREAAEAREVALGQVERCRHGLEECARARELVARKKSERDKVAYDKQAYTELAAAFGKKGVQAHIIDNALPELQEETNRLLARLTDNAMQVGLSTLRQARTGSSQIETLDIAITDDAGTRPYEMYSGGEAFRINFALRIALSRLLARRAGARLQTLILDEGFGTQDAKGRERLVEAIEAIKEEFALILVISHIEDLKDAFPTRIEIVKTPAGSQISMME